jgi:hypothetical protein
MCDCGAPDSNYQDYRMGPKKESKILNKWIVDNHGRKLLISSPIYDTYNDIIGYVTKDETGNVIRIFERNIKNILN